MTIFLAFLILGSAGLWSLAWGWGMVLSAPTLPGFGALALGLFLWAVLYLFVQFEHRRHGR